MTSWRGQSLENSSVLYCSQTWPLLGSFTPSRKIGPIILQRVRR